VVVGPKELVVLSPSKCCETSRCGFVLPVWAPWAAYSSGFDTETLPSRTRVLERASEAAWKAILSEEGVGFQIKEQVEKTWWELNGWGTPPQRARPSEKKPAPLHHPIESQIAAPPTSVVPAVSGPAAEQASHTPEVTVPKPEGQTSIAQTDASALLSADTSAACLLNEEPQPDLKEVQYVPLVSDLMDGGTAPSVGMSISAASDGNGGLAAQLGLPEGTIAAVAAQGEAAPPENVTEPEIATGVAANNVETLLDVKAPGQAGPEAAAPVSVPEQQGKERPRDPTDALGKQEHAQLQGLALGSHKGIPGESNRGNPEEGSKELATEGQEPLDAKAAMAVMGKSNGEKLGSALLEGLKEDQPTKTEAVALDRGEGESAGPSGTSGEGGVSSTQVVKVGPIVGLRAYALSSGGARPAEASEVHPPTVSGAKDSRPSSPIEVDVKMVEASPLDALGSSARKHLIREAAAAAPNAIHTEPEGSGTAQGQDDAEHEKEAEHKGLHEEGQLADHLYKTGELQTAAGGVDTLQASEGEREEVEISEVGGILPGSLRGGDRGMANAESEIA
jgi:hypothetical protein